MTALDAFIARKANIDAMLTRLQDMSDDHFDADPDEIHWGHVGDLGRIEQLLSQIIGDKYRDAPLAEEQEIDR